LLGGSGRGAKRFDQSFSEDTLNGVRSDASRYPLVADRLGDEEIDDERGQGRNEDDLQGNTEFWQTQSATLQQTTPLFDLVHHALPCCFFADANIVTGEIFAQTDWSVNCESSKS
jgi:hypothetical protein